MVYTIFKNNACASLVILPAVISVATYVMGFGMIFSSSRNIAQTGTCLLLTGALIFYVIAGVAVNSIFLNTSTRSPRSITFISIFILAAIGLVVSSTIIISKEDHSTFLLVRLPPPESVQSNPVRW
jgi:hypothetical protein